MLFRWGPGGGFGVELCVARALRVVEKAVRPSCALRLEHGCMRGSRKDGRRRAMASEGLYMAVIMTGGEFDRTVIVPTIKMRGRSS
jgi:hypothetical protein